MTPSVPPPVSAPPPQRQSEPPQTFSSYNSRQGPPGPAGDVPPQQSPIGPGAGYNQGPPSAAQHQLPYQHERSFSQGGRPQSTEANNGPIGRMGNGNSMP